MELSHQYICEGISVQQKSGCHLHHSGYHWSGQSNQLRPCVPDWVRLWVGGREGLPSGFCWVNNFLQECCLRIPPLHLVINCWQVHAKPEISSTRWLSAVISENESAGMQYTNCAVLLRSAYAVNIRIDGVLIKATEQLSRWYRIFFITGHQRHLRIASQALNIN